MRGIVMQELSVLGLLRGVKTQTRRLAGPDGDRPRPLYKVGETLYVKEAWFYPAGRGAVFQRDRSSVVYQAHETGEQADREWWNRLFMPQWAARFEVTITEVRRQALLDLTDADADAEGIDVMHGWLDDAEICRCAKIAGCSFEDSRAWYLAAWDEMHRSDRVRIPLRLGDPGWRSHRPWRTTADGSTMADKNPVVDAYTFTAQRLA